MQLFYNSEIKKGDSNFFFDKEESKHIVKVLRKKEGDKIKAGEVIAEIQATMVPQSDAEEVVIARSKL